MRKLIEQEDIDTKVELSKSVGLAKTTLTSMLDRMEEAELIKRLPDAHDRRKSILILTERARGLQEKYEQVSQEMNDIYYRGFREEEILYGTYKEDGTPNFGLFCWLSYYWDTELCVMACIGGNKLTKDRIHATKVFSANLVTEEMLPLADYLGTKEGYEKDKIPRPLRSVSAVLHRSVPPVQPIFHGMARVLERGEYRKVIFNRVNCRNNEFILNAWHNNGIIKPLNGGCQLCHRLFLLKT